MIVALSALLFARSPPPAVLGAAAGAGAGDAGGGAARGAQPRAPEPGPRRAGPGRAAALDAYVVAGAAMAALAGEFLVVAIVGAAG